MRVVPKKSLGQHFLADEGYLARIVETAELTPADAVLEIGPGQGGLTRHLAAQAGRVVAVELDDRLIEPLRRQFSAAPQVAIIHGDILEIDPAALLAETGAPISHSPRSNGYKVVANIPYYITGPILRHLLEAACPPKLTVLLVQKEVAERICAAPGDMSLLAVSVQFYAAPRLICTVPAGAFRPRPKVESAVLRLDTLSAPAAPDLPASLFFQVARAGFGQKRKQLHNSLAAGLHLPKPAIDDALRRAGVTPSQRPEDLTLEQWAALTRTLAPHMRDSLPGC
jgi:16S rRNA (adenine1518-N6/adenine1519-N6)-dimethyltransferase